MAKHLQTSQAIWDEINLISFRAEKFSQNVLQDAIGLYDQNSIRGGRSQFAHRIVHGCRQGGVTTGLFAFRRQFTRLSQHCFIDDLFLFVYLPSWKRSFRVAR